MQATANNIFHLSLTFFFFFMVLLSLGTSAAGVASDTLSNGRNLTDGNTLVSAGGKTAAFTGLQAVAPSSRWPVPRCHVVASHLKPRDKRVGIPGESANRRYKLSPRLFLAMSTSSPTQSKHLDWLAVVPGEPGEKGGQLGIPIESANRRYRFSPMMFLMSLAVSESSPVQSKHLGWLDMMPVAVKLV
uniref:Uncharacterized protein n=1 Tax=Oryza meridionalis TaxID=40149 RepID=A0A0E0DIT1_9ORYZ